VTFYDLLIISKGYETQRGQISDGKKQDRETNLTIAHIQPQQAIGAL